MTKEIWKPIINFEKYYLVSNKGRVKSLDRIVPFGSQKRTVKGRTLRQIDHGNGYVYVTFSTKGKHKNNYVHRLVCEAFKANPENLKEVNHIDGNKQNNCIENLEWISGIENKRHAMRIGLSAKGSKKTTALLTRSEARQIKREKLVGIPSNVIANKFKVSIGLINEIARNHNYYSDTKDIPTSPETLRKLLQVWYGIKHRKLSVKNSGPRAILTVSRQTLIDKSFETEFQAREEMKKSFKQYLETERIVVEV